MSTRYLQNALAPNTQTEQNDPRQVKNNAGGFVFQVDDWERLRRFLILGSEGGTYYSSEQKLTRENAKCVERLVALDGPKLVAEIVAISDSGRAPKNDPAILSLAIAARLGNAETKAAAYTALPKVCRIGTHLYHFVAFADQLGGWGRSLRRGVASWFTGKNADDLAYQLVKYQSRDGWSARDLLRLSHAKPPSKSHEYLFGWATGSQPDSQDAIAELPPIVHAFEEAKSADKARLLKLIREYKLSREMVPTQHLTDPDVWDAMLPHMGLTAMIRNLGTMTKIGLIAPLSERAAYVAAKINDGDALKKARIHPIQMLSALKTYGQGHGEKGSSTWSPAQLVVDALDEGFYASFAAIKPTGKPTLLALDVSPSMWGSPLVGMTGLTAAEGAAVMALVTAASEARYHIVGFAGRLADIPISPKMRLTQAMEVLAAKSRHWSRTDCALPFVWAREGGYAVESFAIYTDNDTWAGNIHPNVALQLYRSKSGLAARSAVVAFSASPFTIADPSDAGMMDFVGFDASAPAVMADFFAGRGTNAAAGA